MYKFCIFIAWGLFTSLSGVRGQVTLPGGCPPVKPFKYLDLNRYGGDWYEVERFFFLPQLTGSCVSVNYSPASDGTLKTTIRLKESVSGKKFVLPGVTHFLDPSPNKNFTIGNMQLTLDLVQPFVPQPKLQHTYSYKLADTDYYNYIIKFGCTSLVAAHFESVWILARNPNYPPHVRAMVRQSLEALGINKKHLIRSSCDEESYFTNFSQFYPQFPNYPVNPQPIIHPINNPYPINNPHPIIYPINNPEYGNEWSTASASASASASRVIFRD